MQPWLNPEQIPAHILKDALRTVDVSRQLKRKIASLIDDYSMFRGQLPWKEDEISDLQDILRSILALTDRELEKLSSPKDLEMFISSKLNRMASSKIHEICYVLTLRKEAAL